jgi:hypothetical protein
MKSQLTRCTVLLVLLGLSGALQAAEPPALLSLTGTDGKTQSLTAADLAKLPRRTVTEGKTKYEGVPLAEVLRLAGAPLGDALRHHEPPTWYVVVEAQDGYRVLFSLAELDPAFVEREVLLVDRQDDQPIAADQGPLRLIAPGDKRHARWAHQVTGVRLERLTATAPKALSPAPAQ